MCHCQLSQADVHALMSSQVMHTRPYANVFILWTRWCIYYCHIWHICWICHEPRLVGRLIETRHLHTSLRQKWRGLDTVVMTYYNIYKCGIYVRDHVAWHCQSPGRKWFVWKNALRVCLLPSLFNRNGILLVLRDMLTAADAQQMTLFSLLDLSPALHCVNHQL